MHGDDMTAKKSAAMQPSFHGALCLMPRNDWPTWQRCREGDNIWRKNIKQRILGFHECWWFQHHSLVTSAPASVSRRLALQVIAFFVTRWYPGLIGPQTISRVPLLCCTWQVWVIENAWSQLFACNAHRHNAKFKKVWDVQGLTYPYSCIGAHQMKTQGHMKQ